MTTRMPILCLAMLLLGGAPVLAAHDFEWHVPLQGAVSPLSTLNSFETEIINTGDQADTYTITLGKNHPLDWVSSLCEGQTCYLPWIVEIEVSLAPGDTASLLVDLTPLDQGSGTATASVTSQGNPSLTETRDFTVLTRGLQTLIVASDNQGGHDDWYTASVGAAGKSSGVWHRQTMGPVTLTDLQAFGAVIWLAGNHPGSLDVTDRSVLASYLYGGGHLFLSGRDLAWEHCDPGSPWYSAGTEAWFNVVLGADYAGTLPASYGRVEGVPGDLLGNGLAFDIFGGTGADNARFDFDVLTAAGTGLPGFSYVDGTAGGTAGIRHLYGAGKVLTLGFGFEAIALQTDRDALMDRVLAWFDGQLVPVSDDTPALLVGPARAVPNPFNPRTRLSFEVGGRGESVPVDVTVYDVRGRPVRRLFSGDLAPGPRDVAWDGRDDNARDLPAGLYLARITTDGPSQTVKMTLAK